MAKTEQDLQYHALKRELGITDDQVAEWFSYSTPQSFRNSARKDRTIKGILCVAAALRERYPQRFSANHAIPGQIPAEDPAEDLL